MSERATIQRLDVFADPRGAVYEPLLPEQLPPQRNVHVVVTEPGQIRGNHLHQRGTEILTVLGPALVRLQDESRQIDTQIEKGEAYRFVIPPGIAHAILAIGPEPMLIVAFNNDLFDRDHPDVVRKVLLE
ncbi:MAG: cupin domain-containing protein [Pirellulaceae bacterium]